MDMIKNYLKSTLFAVLLMMGCSNVQTSSSSLPFSSGSSLSSSWHDSTPSMSSIVDDLQPANLTTFATDRVSDPTISYLPSDYIVRPFLNGYSYPSDAQVQPTPAYLEFWHAATDLDFRIIAQPQIFQWMQRYGVDEQSQADLYWPVTLEITMNSKRFVYYEVGMRMKGNTSRTPFLDADGHIVGSLSFKLSFDELWDTPEYAPFGLQKTWTEDDDPEWTSRDQRTIMGNEFGLFGMKKLDIKWNKTRDDSLVIQPFIFGFFQQQGLMSQNSTLTRLRVNNTRMGIVTINEPVDKHLLRRYLPSSAAVGDLYKVGWGQIAPGQGWVKGSLRYEDLVWDGNQLITDAIIGEEDKSRGYTPAYDAKEYDARLANPHEKLIHLMRVLKDNEGKSPAEYTTALEAVVDIDSFLRYSAVSYLVGNIDDMRNWGNNYYIFFDPMQNNKAYFLPYDFDWGLGLTWVAGDTKMYGASPFDTRYLMNTHLYQENRLFWYTILSTPTLQDVPYPTLQMNPSYRNQYVTNIKTLNADTYYSKSYYETLYTTYKTTYQSKSGSDLGDISSFRSTAFMKGFIDSMKEVVNTLP